MILAALGSTSQLAIAHPYWIIFPLAVLEGPAVGFAVGSLAAIGALDVGAALAALVLGDLVPDVSLFLIGRRAGRSRRLARLTERYDRAGRSARAVHRAWRKHGIRTMFISKLAYGLSAPLLLSAGSSGLSISRLVAYALPVTALQYGTLFTIGYYFGSLFHSVIAVWQYAGFVAAGIVLVFVLRLLIGRRLARRVATDGDHAS